MVRNKILIIFCVVSIISLQFVGCSQTKLPPCVPKSSKGITIRWGEVNSKNKIETFYELNDKCIIQLGIIQSRQSDTTKQKIGKISESDYCNIYRALQDAITKTQALNMPGDIQNYVEYIDRSNNVYFRALWNQEYTNAGNKHFRLVFDSLQATVSKLMKE